jgi:hypothetical protein
VGPSRQGGPTRSRPARTRRRIILERGTKIAFKSAFNILFDVLNLNVVVGKSYSSGISDTPVVQDPPTLLTPDNIVVCAFGKRR